MDDIVVKHGLHTDRPMFQEGMPPIILTGQERCGPKRPLPRGVFVVYRMVAAKTEMNLY